MKLKAKPCIDVLRASHHQIRHKNNRLVAGRRGGWSSEDNDIDMGRDSSGSGHDFSNYTVSMPPTPDNQPNGAGPSPGTSRLAAESQGSGGSGKFERRMSVLNSVNNKSMSLSRSQTQDFDHNRWLFESRGTYGIGNAYWQNDDGYGDGGMSMADFMDKPWKPLTRKVSVKGSVLGPYRYNPKKPFFFVTKWFFLYILQIPVIYNYIYIHTHS